MVFLYKTVHLSEDPCYTLSKSGLIESPYIQATRTRFVQPGKIEIVANERAVIGKRNAAFSFAPPSILSLTIYILEYLSCLLPSGFEISSNDIHFSSAQFRYLVYHVWNS